MSTGLLHYLESHQGSAEYLVAVQGSQTAAPYILESGRAVIAMGGFTGSDPTPTLAQFEALVKAGKVRYVVIGGGAGSGRRIVDLLGDRPVGHRPRDRGAGERLRRLVGRHPLRGGRLTAHHRPPSGPPPAVRLARCSSSTPPT